MSAETPHRSSHFLRDARKVGSSLWPLAKRRAKVGGDGRQPCRAIHIQTKPGQNALTSGAAFWDLSRCRLATGAAKRRMMPVWSLLPRQHRPMHESNGGLVRVDHAHRRRHAPRCFFPQQVSSIERKDVPVMEQIGVPARSGRRQWLYPNSANPSKGRIGVGQRWQSPLLVEY